VLPFFDSHEVKLLRVLAIDRPFGQPFRNPKAQPQPGHVPKTENLQSTANLVAR
jgi:hypothetical protein